MDFNWVWMICKQMVYEQSSCSFREYHGITRGFVAQEVFRRVEPAGRTIGQFLRWLIGTILASPCYIIDSLVCFSRQEVLGPLGADVFIGLSEEEQEKRHIANVEAPSDKDVIIPIQSNKTCQL